MPRILAAITAVIAIGVMIIAAIFGLINAGKSKGELDAIKRANSANEAARERADQFDDNLSICKSRGLRFDFTTGECRQP